MELFKSFRTILILNLLMIFSFSISVNSFVYFSNINLVSYIFFHLILIYYCIYHYHYSVFLIIFIYGIFLDILLLNNIGNHLFILILFVSVYTIFKKYLFQLTSYQITITIFISLILILFSEMLLANLLNNYKLNYFEFLKILFISIIIFFPSIILFTKLDK